MFFAQKVLKITYQIRLICDLWLNDILTHDVRNLYYILKLRILPITLWYDDYYDKVHARNV